MTVILTSLFISAIVGPIQYAATEGARAFGDSVDYRRRIASDRPVMPPQRAPAGLAGTSWQLVKFQGMDDTTRTPDDGSKYTIAFGGDGFLTVRIDCNRGRGTWKSAGPSHLELGPLALTRAMCPPGSLHDQIVKHWTSIRSYVIKDGHLFLSLMADGGIYEFAPMARVDAGAP